MLRDAVRWACLLGVGIFLVACGGGPSMYDPQADPQDQLAKALERAEGLKPVLMQVGGDWCSWCRKFNGLIAGHAELSAQMGRDFEWIHIYYARGARNEAFLRQYVSEGVRMSFPCFILLGDRGEFIGYYESGGLEDGSGYDSQRVSEFLTKLRADYEAHGDEIMESAAREQAVGDSLAVIMESEGGAE